MLAAGSVVPLLGIGIGLGTVGGSPADSAAHAACLVAVAIGWLLHHRDRSSPVAPALAWSSAAVSLVALNDTLAASWYTDGPLPLASLSRHVWAGLWPVNLAGLFALLLVFPDGRRRGRYWSALPFAYALAVASMALAQWDAQQAGGEVVGESSPLRSAAGLVGIVLVAACLVSAVISLVLAYREGGERRRLQVRWLMLAGATSVLLLICGWVAEALGASIDAAYTPFILSIVVLVPAAVGIAMIRHDLFDVDRILGTGGSWLLTLAVSAGVFGVVVTTISRTFGAHAGLSQASAAFVTAIVLLPLHHLLVTLVGRVVDRDRHVAIAQIEQFAADVRSGVRQPESIEEVLREAQGDPDLALVLRRPDGQWVRLSGEAVGAPDGIRVEVAGDLIAVVELGWDSARARRRIADLTRAAWVTIEVSRLRSVLRDALDEVSASQTRLAEAAATERHRLERDLHDGAQQRIVATGMRLRILQRHVGGHAASELETAVDELEQTVRELRDLAHGVRPIRLSDGLHAALEAVRDASPVPVSLSVREPATLDETRRVTAYLVISEAVTNALKHAAATRIEVSVDDLEGRVLVMVSDDGVGGVLAPGPTALRDRVLSVGGQLTVRSPAQGGTTVTALL